MGGMEMLLGFRRRRYRPAPAAHGYGMTAKEEKGAGKTRKWPLFLSANLLILRYIIIHQTSYKTREGIIPNNWNVRVPG
jgi:hypothetical protein